MRSLHGAQRGACLSRGAPAERALLAHLLALDPADRASADGALFAPYREEMDESQG